MTTILADYRLGVMVSDSNLTDGDRHWSGRKVHRVRDALCGFAGHVPDFENFIAWYRGGMKTDLKFDTDESDVLVLRPQGLFMFDDNSTSLQKVKQGYESIGTGGKAAIAAYEALLSMSAYEQPKQLMRAAVRIACKHDANSRTPVRTYHLKGQS